MHELLLVDDDPNIRATVRACFAPESFTSREASDGVEALDAIAVERPDVVVLDLAMPRMDGMSFLAELRLRHPPNYIRTVVMTAHGSIRHAIDAIRLGACDFLEKPFLPDDLRISVACATSELPEDTAQVGYLEVLGVIRRCLRTGDEKAAKVLLGTARTMNGGASGFEPQYLNLAGVFVEANRRPSAARRYYEASLRADPSFAAAENNLKRLDEISRLGHSDRDVTLGGGEWFSGAEASGKGDPAHRLDSTLERDSERPILDAARRR